MASASAAAPVHPIHFVLGESAAGCVRAACVTWGMPGTVIGFSDDLAHGPLHGDEARCIYMRPFLDIPGGEANTYRAPHEQWQAVIEQLDLDHPDAVVVWSGANVADTIFIAMACDRLAGRPEPLWLVQVPAIDGRPFVAMHSPEHVALLYATRAPLNAADRQSLAQEFARIRDTCGPVRRLEQSQVVGVPMDHYDPLLMEACGSDWQPAGRVVGTAMGQCDGPNLMGDGFFSARLGFLVDAGRIEANGPRTAWRNFSVRLAKS